MLQSEAYSNLWMIGGISISTGAKIHFWLCYERGGWRGKKCAQKATSVSINGSCKMCVVLLVRSHSYTRARVLSGCATAGYFLEREKKSHVKAMCPRGMCTIGIHVGWEFGKFVSARALWLCLFYFKSLARRELFCVSVGTEAWSRCAWVNKEKFWCDYFWAGVTLELGLEYHICFCFKPWACYFWSKMQNFALLNLKTPAK